MLPAILLLSCIDRSRFAVWGVDNRVVFSYLEYVHMHTTRRLDAAKKKTEMLQKASRW